jgi:outer membrane immunogenic protein
MKTKLLGLGLAVAAFSMMSLVAQAADLPQRAAAPAQVYTKAPMPAYFSWTGVYLGGNIGGLSASKSISLVGVPLGSNSPSGLIAGGQLGFNWQTGAWVFGVQADYDWANASASSVDTVFPANTDRARIRGLASVTGRFGYAMDRALIYVKGGGAWASDKYDSFVTATGAPVASGSETRSGWTAGVGLEYAFMGNWSGFAEYDYYGFGTRGVAFTLAGGGAAGTFDIKQTANVFKAGINYRFGM